MRHEYWNKRLSLLYNPPINTHTKEEVYVKKAHKDFKGKIEGKKRSIEGLWLPVRAGVSKPWFVSYMRLFVPMCAALSPACKPAIHLPAPLPACPPHHRLLTPLPACPHCRSLMPPPCVPFACSLHSCPLPDTNHLPPPCPHHWLLTPLPAYPTHRWSLISSIYIPHYLSDSEQFTSLQIELC